MKMPTDAKLETIFIAWCDAIRTTNPPPFNAFLEGFQQGMIYAEPVPKCPYGVPGKEDCEIDCSGWCPFSDLRDVSVSKKKE